MEPTAPRPKLTGDEIALRVREVAKGWSRPYIALDGEGDEQVIDVANARIRVVPTTSELELRRHLPMLDAELDAVERCVFLVPWAARIPDDIANAFAENGRVFPIGRRHRIQQLFGVSSDASLDENIFQSALAKMLVERGSPPISIASAGGRITLPMLWDAWLRTRWGVPELSGLSLDMLLAWAARDARGGVFVDSHGDANSPLCKELGRLLDERVGPAGALVWGAWLKGAGAPLFELALLFSAVPAEPAPPVLVWADLKLQHVAHVNAGQQILMVLTSLGKASTAAIRRLESQDAHLARRLLDSADQRVDEVLRPLVAESSILPSGWRGRMSALSESLRQNVERPSPPAFEKVRVALRALEAHSLAQHESATPLLRVADMAVRLSAFLVQRTDAGAWAGESSYAELEHISRWYAADGGFIDAAAEVLAVDVDSPLREGVTAVREKVAELRRSLDRRFARAIKPWLLANRPNRSVVAADVAMRGFGLEFIQSQFDTRRVLVILLHGCGWAHVAPLLDRLRNAPVPRGPSAWMAQRMIHLGGGSYPAVIAPLPPEPHAVRASLLGAEAQVNANARKTDDRRFASLKVSGTRGKDSPETEPRFLPWSELRDPSGKLAADARTLIGDPKRALVGLSLDGIAEAIERTGFESGELPEMLNEVLDLADRAGRVVLLTSDGGSLPARHSTSVGLRNGGQRWRPLLDGEEADEHEIELLKDARNGMWTPKDGTRIAALVDTDRRHGTDPVERLTGGASLAEMVVPLVLISPEVGPFAFEDDKELQMRAPYVPRWWLLDIDIAPVPRELPKKEPTKKPKVVSEFLPISDLNPPLPVAPQGGVASRKPSEPMDVLPPVETKPAKKTTRYVPRKAAKVVASELFQQKCDERDLKPEQRDRIAALLDFLLTSDGAVSFAAVAAALQETLSSVRGLLTRATEIVNDDGYMPLAVDFFRSEVRFNGKLLFDLFEENP